MAILKGLFLIIQFSLRVYFLLDVFFVLLRLLLSVDESSFARVFLPIYFPIYGCKSDSI